MKTSTILGHILSGATMTAIAWLTIGTYNNFHKPKASEMNCDFPQVFVAKEEMPMTWISVGENADVISSASSRVFVVPRKGLLTETPAGKIFSGLEVTDLLEDENGTEKSEK